METPAPRQAEASQLGDSELDAAKTQIKELRDTLGKILFGQDELIHLVVIGLLARGHLLLEGLPGLGKTELVKGLSKAMRIESKRIQFTPDLLPGDITGNPLLQEVNGTRRFVFQQGPLFSNIVLADEINRASPKTQSALLEAMQERRATVMGETHVLPDPFFVLATQNPIELEGTYPLPEAQLDRFLFKLNVHRVNAETLEQIVLRREIGIEPEVTPVIDRERFTALANLVRRIYMPSVVANYIARLVDATHAADGTVRFGASPRAALALASAAKARALADGRLNAAFEDVRALAPAVLRHRIVLDYTAKLEGKSTDDFVQKLLETVPANPKNLPDTLQSAKLK